MMSSERNTLNTLSNLFNKLILSVFESYFPQYNLSRDIMSNMILEDIKEIRVVFKNDNYYIQARSSLFRALLTLDFTYWYGVDGNLALRTSLSNTDRYSSLEKAQSVAKEHQKFISKHQQDLKAKRKELKDKNVNLGTTFKIQTIEENPEFFI